MYVDDGERPVCVKDKTVILETLKSLIKYVGSLSTIKRVSYNVKQDIQ